jgi:predicted  nucleic acid-binding Zn-ribbon protein
MVDITFGKPKEEPVKKEEKKREQDVISQKIESQVANVSRRLRILEERYSSLREQIRFTDQSFLSSKNKLSADIKSADKELEELNSQILGMKEKINDLLKELSLCAKDEDLKVIEKYIEIWEPVEFITRKEALDLIRRKI